MFDVVAVGKVNRDAFIRSGEFKLLKDKKAMKELEIETEQAECFPLGIKTSIEKPIFAGGGGAHNAAVTFARHGLKTGVVGSIGDDLAGKDITRFLRDEGVKTFFKTDKKEGTGYSVVISSPDGERTIFVYPGASDKLKDADIRFPQARARWFYISPGAIPVGEMEKFVSRAKKSGAKVAMNPSGFYIEKGKNEMKRIFPMLDVIIVNREEAALITGVPYSAEKKIFKEFDRITTGIAVITDGKNGASVSDRSYRYHIESFPEKEIAERTGAGDAFGSGFVATLMHANDTVYALRFAAANATSVIESVGAASGILAKKDFENPRWKEADCDIEPL